MPARAPPQESAGRHRSVTELWFVTGGHGRMWRQIDHDGDEVPLCYGTSVSIDTAERLQFRSTGVESPRVRRCDDAQLAGND